ncbi:IS66 family insertion sequence element accessory protein TnpB [Oscillospiraceae bacterium HV4-5-C5C]|nr:IS66 family insertion sequence element accessory protein TnpB [Oscillospiraceae bacterium HV4-5-C5C]
MLKQLPQDMPVYLACGYTDLRKGIDGLTQLVQDGFHLDPFSPSLFLFCGRRSNRFKALYWDENGFELLYKCLETGSVQWPGAKEDVRRLSPQQYRWLLEGLSIDQPRAIPSIERVYTG